jgi:hypothetical protein
MVKGNNSFAAFRTAFDILEKYTKKNAGFVLGAEHEVIYSYVSVEDTSEEDSAELERLGWYKDSENCIWACFT